MYDENLKQRIFNKLEAALRIYDNLIYRKVGELDNTQVFFTKEHLRAVPKDGFAPIAVFLAILLYSTLSLSNSLPSYALSFIAFSSHSEQYTGRMPSKAYSSSFPLLGKILPHLAQVNIGTFSLVNIILSLSVILLYLTYI